MKNAALAPLHSLVWTGLLAASIAAGAFISLPLGPVPVSMQPFFVFLAGYILGPARGGLCVLLYVFAGLIGLPVFSGGRSGLAHLLGPTGGYLAGFIVAAAMCGLAGRKGKVPSWTALLSWGLVGLAAAYGLGALRLKFILDLSWAKAAAVGIAPFVVWDLLKLAAAAACRRHLGRQGLLP